MHILVVTCVLLAFAVATVGKPRGRSTLRAAFWIWLGAMVLLAASRWVFFDPMEHRYPRNPGLSSLENCILFLAVLFSLAMLGVRQWPRSAPNNFQEGPSAVRFSLTHLLALLTFVSVLCGIGVAFYPFGPVYAWCLLALAVCALGARLKKGLVVVSGIAMLAATGVAISIVSMSAHLVPLPKLQAVQPGDTAEKVLHLLGRPTSIRRTAVRETWAYSGAKWCCVTIELTDGIVTEVVHDH